MATILEIIVKAVDRASGTINRINTTTDGMATKLATASAVATRTGTSLTRNLTLPIALAGFAAAKAGADFESSFAGVRKTVDASEPEFAALAQGFRDMAKEVPITVHELNAIGEAAGQLGIRKEAILGFTKTVADLGVTTNLTSEEAGNALARISNIMGTSQGDFDRLGSTIVGLGNAGASTERDIVAMGLRIAGAGKQINLSEADVLGFSNALASVGVDAEAGGTAISRVMIDIAKAVRQGGDELDAFAEVAGMSSEKFKASFEKDAAGAIVTFIEGLGKIKKEGGDVFTTLEDLGLADIRVRDSLLRASGAGDLFRQSLKLGREEWEKNTALAEEAEKRYATFSSRLGKLRNRVYDVAITLGTALLPVLSLVVDRAEVGADRLARLATWFSKLPIGVQKSVIAALALAAALGPALLIIGKVIAAVRIGVLIFGALASPIGLIALAVAGLILVLHKLGVLGAIFDPLKRAFGAFMDAFRGGSGVIRSVQMALAELGIPLELTSKIIRTLARPLGAIRDAFSTLFSSVGGGIGIVRSIQLALAELGVPLAFTSKVVLEFQRIWAAVWPVVLAVLTEVVGFVVEKFAEVRDGIMLHWDEIKATIAAAISHIQTILTVWITIVMAIFRAAWPVISAILIAAWGVIKAVISSALQIIGAAIRVVMALIRGDWSAAWGAMKDLVRAILTGIVSVIGAILGGVVSVLGALAGAWLSAARALAGKIIDGIRAALTNIAGVMRGALNGALSYLRNTVPGIVFGYAVSIGKSLVSGIVSGLGGLLGAVKDKIVGGVQGAINGAKGALGIRSPSKVTADEIGKPISEGIARGILQASPVIRTSLRSAINAAMANADAFGSFSQIVQRIFQQRQAGQTTKSERQIEAIERRRTLEGLQRGIAEAQSPEDLARAKEDLKLFHLREKAERERARLDDKQFVAQTRLTNALGRLEKVLSKGLGAGAERAAIRRFLRAQGIRIPGFATGGIVPGMRGAPLLALVHGGEEISRPRQGGGRGPDAGALLAELRTVSSLLRRQLARDRAINLDGRRLDEAIARRVRSG